MEQVIIGKGKEKIVAGGKLPSRRYWFKTRSNFYETCRYIVLGRLPEEHTAGAIMENEHHDLATRKQFVCG